MVRSAGALGCPLLHFAAALFAPEQKSKVLASKVYDPKGNENGRDEEDETTSEALTELLQSLAGSGRAQKAVAATLLQKDGNHLTGEPQVGFPFLCFAGPFDSSESCTPRLI